MTRRLVEFDGRRDFVAHGMLVHVHMHAWAGRIVPVQPGTVKAVTRDMVLLKTGQEFQRRHVHYGDVADCSVEGRRD